MSVDDYLNLADWRREVAALYGRIRESADPQLAWQDFRRTRDRLYLRHPQTPLDRKQRARFQNLRYYSYSPRLRLTGSIELVQEQESRSIELPTEGLIRFSSIARIHFTILDQPVQLSLYWIEGYGGGLFLPFRDGTNGRGSYGGGRYLYDGIKGADLGAATETILLDFNFAYNPSCAYNDRWICPLAPPENWLTMAIEAGEKSFS